MGTTWRFICCLRRLVSMPLAPVLGGEGRVRGRWEKGAPPCRKRPSPQPSPPSTGERGQELGSSEPIVIFQTGNGYRGLDAGGLIGFVDSGLGLNCQAKVKIMAVRMRWAARAGQMDWGRRVGMSWLRMVR